jgi:hypothetical protein
MSGQLHASHWLRVTVIVSISISASGCLKDIPSFANVVKFEQTLVFGYKGGEGIEISVTFYKVQWKYFVNYFSYSPN